MLHAKTLWDIYDVGVNTDAYASGDCMDSAEHEITHARGDGQGGVIQTITVVDLTKQDAEIELLFFDKEPENTTFTNNSALDVHDTDLDNAIGSVTIAASDYDDYADNSIATLRNVGFSYTVRDGLTSLYVIPICRGTPTYAAGELRIRFTIWVD